jgi:hypothetical protein
MLCFIVCNGFLRLIYYFLLLLQQILTKPFAAFWHLHKAVTYEYANETASRAGRNSGTEHNYGSGSPQCYHTKLDEEYLINIMCSSLHLKCGAL